MVLPFAERALDAAFLANRDPLSGHEADELSRPSFRKSLRRLPGTNSIGSVLEALAGAAMPKYRLPP